MKRLVKKLSLVLATAMVFTLVMTGCGTNSNQGKEASAATVSAVTTEKTTEKAADAIDTSKEVDLKMYLLGDKPTDFDAVYAEVNKILKAKVNATLNVDFISWADLQNKYPLVFASGEQFDMAYAASWNNYKAMAAKNSYMELTEDMLKKYAPLSWADQPKITWNQAKVNGKIFMVPQNWKEFNNFVFMIRGDLRTKYNLPEVKTMDDLEKYWFTIAEKEKSIIPYDVGSNSNLDIILLQNKLELNGDNNSGIFQKFSDPNAKPFWLIDTPEYLAYAKKMKEYHDKGVWAKDAASKPAFSKESYVAGKTASTVWTLDQIGSLYVQLQMDHPEWKSEIVNVNSGKKTFAREAIGNGISIKSSSNNPERSLMVIDLLKHDKDLTDLTFLGIKGKHWEPDGDMGFKSLPGASNYGYSGACPWGWFNSNVRLPSNLPAVRNDIYSDWDKNNVVDYALNGFSLDTTSVKTEYATIQNLFKQYIQPMSLGAYSDVEGKLKEYKDKAKAAGIDRIMAEYVKQADEFAKAMK